MQIITHYVKLGALAILTLLSLAGYSQNTLNSYKYVLVPQKFDFLSSVDEYDLNTKTKSLLEQKGFTVFFTNEGAPQIATINRCAILTAEVKLRKAFFTTSLTLFLKDCYGNVIFKSKEGRSWEKAYDTAYSGALKDAFSTLMAFPYKYDSTLAAQPQQPANTNTTVSPPQTPPSPKGVVTDVSPPSPKTAVIDISSALYAQVISNGYQLIDTTPKKVMTLVKTSLPDCYLAQPAAALEPGAGITNGVVFKNKDEWFFEYLKDGVLVSQKLTIKF
jgi:hypothetical protein